MSGHAQVFDAGDCALAYLEQLGLDGPDDIDGFNSALGLTPEGWVPFGDHDAAERFQVLSPAEL